MRLLLANVVLAAAMTGVIWLVQLVVYPMFRDAGASAFPAWDVEHSRRISPLVGPLIAGQVLVAIAVVAATGGKLAWLNLALLGAAILVTGAVSVPLHSELSRGFDAAAIDKLVQTNWLRTIAWSGQLAVACALLLRD